MSGRRTITGALAALVLFQAAAAIAGPPSLGQPIDCTLGETCYIQNFVDDDPGPGASDYRCHGLTYDGHKGTDFALPDLAAMEKGVTVIASAPGRVIGMRDGETDGAYLNDPNSVNGRECGNGVVIDHGDGWQTQYCHMRLGSVTVRKGDTVTIGTALGQVGLSGKTVFPHVHISVRHDGKVIDPFDPDRVAGCTVAPSETLWSETPAYVPGALLMAGFIGQVPDYDQIKAGRAAMARLSPTAPALVLWSYGFGARPGDEMTLTISGPANYHQTTTVKMDRSQALFSRHIGKRHRADWQAGTYTGVVTLSRDGQEIGRKTTRVEVTN